MVVQIEQDKDSEKIFSELNKVNKHRRGNCFSYRNLLLGFLFIIFGLFVGVLCIISATGLVNVPIISQITYPNDPVPIRLVEPVQTDNSSGLSISLDFDNSSRTSVVITEQELTSLIRTPGDDGAVLLKQGQIAIDGDLAEVYGIVGVIGNRNATVRIKFEKQDNDVVMSSLKVGHLVMPASFAQSTISFFAGSDDFLSLRSALNQLFKSTTPRVDIESVELEQGQLHANMRRID